MDKLFSGKGEFYWWTGRCENNGDPLGLGRCQVRIVGAHTQDDNAIPTEALPWAYPITSLDNSAIGGVGKSPIGPQIGTKIFGFFMDGETGQLPVMLGTIPGESNKSFSLKMPYGATAPQPNTSGLVGYPDFKREGDCPDGYNIDSSRTNMNIPDPRTLNISPGDWVLPFTGFVSSAYAERAGRHHGVDICAAGFYQQTDAGNPHLSGRLRGPTNLPVYAAANGIVTYIWTADKGQGGAPTSYDKTGQGSRSYGNAVAIKHVLPSGTYTTIYAHLGVSQDAGKDIPGAGILVTKGQTVSKGQQIGTCGRTHVWDAVTHLHFEVRVGEGLPKTANHINPGRIFPQLNCRHFSYRSWADSQPVYSVKPPYKPSEAPVIALTGPQ